MYLVERHGFIVSVFFLLLSIAVAAVTNKDGQAADTGLVVPTDIQEASPLALPLAEIHHLTCDPQQRLAGTLPQEATASPSDEGKNNKMKDIVIGALRLAGGVLSLVVVLLPFLCLWSSGNLTNTLRHLSEVNLGCTALASYGWLTYSVLQVSFKDYEKTKGIDSIVINGFSWGFVACLLLVVLLCAWESKGMVCLMGLAIHIVLTIGILQFPIFRWVEKGSTAKRIVGVMAGIFQNIAELIPIRKLIYTWSNDAPEGGYPDIPNFKKFIIIFRAFDSVATLYWMLYYLFTYEFDEFGISSIVCGGLSLISFCAHSAWAVKPNGLGQEDGQGQV